MKVHEFSNGFSSSSSWGQLDSPSSLSVSCKRLRPLAPKLSGSPSSPPSSSSGVTSSTFDLKNFIRPDSITGPTKFEHKRDQPQVEMHPGGTRWNPTQEQIGILEMLYKGGMRTPNAQQIEHITSQLGKYGKIEGKNVFYWFQNHKARERQKQKRNNLISLSCQSSFTTSNVSNPSVTTKTRALSSLDHKRESIVEKKELVEENGYKRSCRSWGFENLEIENKRNIYSNVTIATTFNKIIDNVTLELFPLHPEGR